MSEIDALLQLYGAIDRAVVDGEATASSLAPLLGPYRGGAATGWYEGQYLPWVTSVHERAEKRARAKARSDVPDRSKRDVRAAPTLAYADGADERPESVSPPQADDSASLAPRAQEVHDALTAFRGAQVEGRMASRRLLAVTAAARALPRHFGVDGTHADVAHDALRVRHPGLDPDDDGAGRRSELHRRLTEQFTSMKEWPQVVEGAVDGGLLPPSFRSQAVAPPCTGRLIMRPDPGSTDEDPCTVLESEFFTHEITFDQAKNYLEPSNWQFDGSLWCRMEKADLLDTNSWLYHETVSTSCPPGPPGAWSVSTDLQFWFSHPTQNEARAEYDFPPGPLPPLADIEIDEGSLRVIELPDGSVHVKTTKRVRFAGNFDGAGLVMFMCASGYSTMLEDMVFSVATGQHGTLNPFPVPAPQGGPVSSQTNPKKSTGSATAGAKPGDAMDTESLDAIVTETAELIEGYLKDSTEMFTSSLGLIQANNYKVENAWADGIKMWSMYMSGLGKAVDLGTRTAKAVTKKPADET